MGNYNPHAPYILGKEWVPIRQDNFQPDVTTERGYVTRIDHSTIVVTGAYYVADWAPAEIINLVEAMAVYRAGTEDDSGPIRQVIIPVSGVTTTGYGTSLIDAQVLYFENPSDSAAALIVNSDDANDDGFIGLTFDMVTYAQVLNGKRILDVELLYTAASSPLALNTANVFIGRSAFAQLEAFQYASGLEGAATLSTNTEVASLSFSAYNPFYEAGAYGHVNAAFVYPWRSNELALFATSAQGNLKLEVIIGLNGTAGEASLGLEIGYAALRITFCEEQRLLYGGKRLHDSISRDHNGYNYIPLRSTAFANGATLAPGDYTIVHDFADINGEARFNPTSAGGKIPSYLAAIEELYELPSLTPIVINKTLTPNDVFTSEVVASVPQLTLHTAAAVVTGSHPYGISTGAPVYGAVTVNQDISLRPANVSTAYPWVRFYARRFNDTTNPLILSDVTTGLSTTSITVAEFDALPEIIDGWREVTLRFANPPLFANAAGDVNWIWTAGSEVAGNQWQILISSMGSRLPTQAISPASYYSPDGTAVDLVWQSPFVSGIASDTTSDAVIIFSQDPPAVTGFTVEQAMQEVAQVSLNCGVPNGCVATGIGYNAISWDPVGACVSYDEIVVSGWPDAETGQSWVNTTSAFSSDGESGFLSLTTSLTHAWIAVGSVDQDLTVDVTPPVLATGAAYTAWHLIRVTNASNYYAAVLSFSTTGAVTMNIIRRVAGALTTISHTVTLSLTYTPDSMWHIRTRIIGDQIWAKAWRYDEPEADWAIFVVDANLAAGSSAGVAARLESGNTNTLPVLLEYDNFVALQSPFADSTYELQRYDAVDAVWNTIMNTANMCLFEFNDYEARVSVASDYRLRVRNTLDFYGAWVTGSGTIPSPGVDITGDGNSVLIFTSNVGPTGNLAYTMTWDNRPVETYAFPEVDTVQLQRMFGKDYFTAFRPLERGGERFQRTILVNAAAIALPSLANFRGLRDLAWADLPYVCVRDELGNRWYATILVPGGEVAVDRQLYLAQIDVVETSATPYAVDPT